MTREKWVCTVPSWAEATAEQRTLLDAAWQAGELSFLLTPSQLRTYKKIRRWERRGKGRHFALDSGRRWGKSSVLTVIALEDAIRYKGWRIPYCAPTHEQVRDICIPLFEQFLTSCPPGRRPTWVKSESRYVFANTSRIELIGLDIHPDGARGTGVDKVFLDEAGFFKNLEYLTVSIIKPQMLGRAHARVIAASTPPTTPLHYWSTTFVPECINLEAHDKKTLDDADQYDQEEIDAFYNDMPGGREGVAARREFGAEHIVDESLAIVPEFREVKESVVIEVTPTIWRDCYVSLDPGFHDLSFVLFAWWWFEEQKLVIEDEISGSRINSARLASRIRGKEQALWGHCRRRGNDMNTKPQPYLRISDNDMRLITDLQIDHGLTFVPTQKDNLVQQVDRLRVAVQQEKVIIHPRCKKLVAHLEHGVWKKVGKEFDRDNDFGHFDGIAALVYLWRNVQQRRNPVPKMERFVCGDLRAANDNGTRSSRPANSRWAREGKNWRREGYRYLIKTGKTA